MGGLVPELTVDESMAWPFRLRMMLAHTYDMRVGQAVCDGDAHACPACLLVWVAMFRIRIFMFSLLPSRPTVSRTGYDAFDDDILTFHPFLEADPLGCLFDWLLHPHMLYFPARHGMQE